MKSIHKTLSEVNGLLPDDNPQILYDEDKDPQSSLYYTIQEKGMTVPATLKGQIINLSCLSKSCEEEIDMVKEEMKHLFYFISFVIVFKNTYKIIIYNDRVNRNSVSQLLRIVAFIQNQIRLIDESMDTLVLQSHVTVNTD